MISAWPKAASSSSFGQGDVVILKVITPPEDFQKLLSQVRCRGQKSRNHEGRFEIRDCQGKTSREVTIKAVLDTNVVISGIFWKGTPFELLAGRNCVSAWRYHCQFCSNTGECPSREFRRAHGRRYTCN